MSTNLTVSAPSNLPAALAPDLAAAVNYARAEKAPSTRKAYRTDFRLFVEWCHAKGVASLPAQAATVAAFLAAQADAGVRPSTLGRRVAAIRYAHKLADVATPTDAETVRATLRGIRRSLGSAKVRKTPAVAERVKAMVAALPDTMAGKRDRALILLGFGGAFRRSELVALDVADIEIVDAGMRVTIRKSKTDQEGEGATIAIARGAVACPVRALLEWLEAAGIKDGPLFRPINKADRIAHTRLTDRSAANIVKSIVTRIGLDPDAYSGHSLRSGFLTSAASNGASVFKMMDVSRHKSVDVLRNYIRDAELFTSHAGAGLL